MSILNNSLLLGADAGGAVGYQISRSLRFNSADSAYLSRTPASAGNRKTWTWAGWVKRSEFINRSFFFGISDVTTANYFVLEFDGAARFSVGAGGTGGSCYITTAQVFRDPAAWFHIVVALDTTQATASSRLRIYVNGVQVTAFSSATYPAQNADQGINSAQLHAIGRIGSYAGLYFSGYLADIHFIDGQALTPTSFGEFSATTGVWMPKAYSGSYGTNGFRLTFADNSAATATTLGKDAAGSNNWTPNNLSVTAGAGNDSFVDSPTNYGTDTGAGGEVRGNYATWNPNNYTSAFFSDGNLKFAPTSGYNETAKATMAIGNKCYFEVTILSPNTAQNYLAIGLMRQETQVLAGPTTGYNISVGASGNYTGSVAYFPYGGVVRYNGSDVVSGLATCAVGDIVGISHDPSNGQVKVYKNGTALNSGNAVYTLSTSYSYVPAMTEAANNAYYVNFGQRPFAYTAPSGFKALCTANLPAPTIVKPSTVFDTKLYTSNAGTNVISGLGFSPDLAWLKSRGTGVAHALYDTVRGAGYALSSNLADAEKYTTDGFVSFNSDGFTLGANVNSPQPDINFTNAVARVAWCWDAGSSTVTNTAGSISSQVRANASAGFSIVSYTGTGANATIGHGLGAAPDLIIVKSRSDITTWRVWNRSVYTANGASSFLNLNDTSAAQTNTVVFNSGNPSSTTFPVGNSFSTNGLSQTFVAYCFAPVSGYSAFGSYTGNGLADGPLVYTGFRPRWVMIKNTSASTNWILWDSARDIDNVIDLRLRTNTSESEASLTDAFSNVDFLSNGFKLRSSGGGDANSNGATYIYAAFAEAPFNFSRAR